MTGPPTDGHDLLTGTFPQVSQEQRVRQAIVAAVQAPSIHNTQPWQFRLRDDPRRVELWADRSRQLPEADPRGRQLTISCGAAAFNLGLQLQLVGLRASFELLPEPDRPDLLAVITVAELADDGMSEPDRALAAANGQRRTVRSAFADRPVDIRLLLDLVGAAEREGAECRLIGRPGEMAGVAHWTAAGQRVQDVDSRLRRELATWTRPEGALAADGVVAAAFGRDSAANHEARFPQRDFAMGRPVANIPGAAADEAVQLLVLATEYDDSVGWLRAGMALQRLLLTAAAEGVMASYLNQSIEISALRPRLQHEVGLRGHPQMLMRVGYPQDGAGPVSPRRPMSEVLKP
jgi:nitroreductase